MVSTWATRGRRRWRRSVLSLYTSTSGLSSSYAVRCLPHPSLSFASPPWCTRDGFPTNWECDAILTAALFAHRHSKVTGGRGIRRKRPRPSCPVWPSCQPRHLPICLCRLCHSTRLLCLRLDRSIGHRLRLPCPSVTPIPPPTSRPPPELPPSAYMPIQRVPSSVPSSSAERGGHTPGDCGVT